MIHAKQVRVKANISWQSPIHQHVHSWLNSSIHTLRYEVRMPLLTPPLLSLGGPSSVA